MRRFKWRRTVQFSILLNIYFICRSTYLIRSTAIARLVLSSHTFRTPHSAMYNIIAAKQNLSIVQSDCLCCSPFYILCVTLWAALYLFFCREDLVHLLFHTMYCYSWCIQWSWDLLSLNGGHLVIKVCSWRSDEWSDTIFNLLPIAPKISCCVSKGIKVAVEIRMHVMSNVEF